MFLSYSDDCTKRFYCTKALVLDDCIYISRVKNFSRVDVCTWEAGGNTGRLYSCLDESTFRFSCYFVFNLLVFISSTSCHVFLSFSVAFSFS